MKRQQCTEPLHSGRVIPPAFSPAYIRDLYRRMIPKHHVPANDDPTLLDMDESLLGYKAGDIPRLEDIKHRLANDDMVYESDKAYVVSEFEDLTPAVACGPPISATMK